MNSLAQDLRYAFRNLRRSPLFTVVALTALALGIGANTAVFTVVESVLLRPLPFLAPDQLYNVNPVSRKPSPFSIGAMTDPQFLACRSVTTAFQQLAAYDGWNWNATGQGDPIRLHGAQVTANLFATLGVQPQFGRAFLPEEESAPRSRVAILSDGLWRSRFEGDRNVLGRTIMLDGEPYAVVGVMPASFDFPNAAQLWAPAVLEAANHHIAFRRVIGRLAPDASPQSAKAELDAVNRRLAKSGERSYEEYEMAIAPLRETMVNNSRQALLVFLGAVGCVLLIACVNMANLLLTRASVRKQEIAIRVSLGAGRWRLARQLLTESAALGIVGGLLGLIVALWGLDLLLRLAPPNHIPRVEEVRFDGWVLAFNLGLSFLTSILFGLAPALQLTGARQPQNWRDAAGRGSSRSGALRSLLVMAEIALALILLIGAGLMLRSFEKLRTVDLGFHPDHTVVMSLELNGERYRTAGPIHTFDHDVLQRISHLSGVTAVGLVNWLPMSGALVQGDFKLGDREVPDDVLAVKPAVSPGYFAAMGVRLLRGRSFEERDTATSPPVAMVDDAFARRFWPGQDPIGKRITFAGQPKPEDWMAVVGVVEPIRQENPASRHLTIYQPVTQVQIPFFLQAVSFAVRTTEPTAEIAPALRSEVWSRDKDLPIHTMASMQDLLDASTAEPLFQTRLITSFSVVAFLLAIIGIYGVMAFAVTQRTREIGIRMAVGAQPGKIVRLILVKSASVITGGLAVGLIGAWAATRVLKSFLYEVTPADPATFVTVSLILAVVALLAGYIPARRAAGIDPLVALRHE